jgi:hypothetical protein
MRRFGVHLARYYSRFRVADRLLLTGHSHQARPDVKRSVVRCRRICRRFGRNGETETLDTKDTKDTRLLFFVSMGSFVLSVLVGT